ncbi:MAG: immunoglobulin domain-containing protein, partial [Verrucomicrobiota bacterium]
MTAPGGSNAFLARLNLDGSVDPAFRFNPAGIQDFAGLARQADGRLVVALRLSAGSAPSVVRRLLPDGSPDATFAGAEVPPPAGLRVPSDGGVLVFGNGGLERRNPDGSPDAAFNNRARLNGQATAVEVDPAGRLYVAGFFSTVGGAPRPGFARLLPDGTLDPSFAPTQSFSGGPTLAAQADGVLANDGSGFYRFTGTGARDLGYGWSTPLAAWALTPDGPWVGVLAGTSGSGVIRTADGLPARPFSTLAVPPSFTGYAWIRVAPDGSLWLARGGNGAQDPATLLFRLQGPPTPLALVSGPSSQTVLAGAEATLQVVATGNSALAYQWRLHGQPLPGATNATLVIRGFQAANAGEYTVVVSNRSGSLTSPPATLALLTPPVVATEPASVVVSAGETARFAVAAAGFQVRYQWRAGNTNLPGATNATLVLSNTGPAQVGSYSVRLTNPAGTLDSRAARLRLRPAAATGVGAGPATGLVRRWRFENNLTESVAGLPTLPFGTPAFAPGVEGSSALSLRTSQNWVQLADAPGVGARLTDELFTVTFWIKPESVGSLNPFSYILLSRGNLAGTFIGREFVMWLGGTDNLLGPHSLKLQTGTFNTATSADPRARVPNLVGKWT